MKRRKFLMAGLASAASPMIFARSKMLKNKDVEMSNFRNIKNVKNTKLSKMLKFQNCKKVKM